MDQWWKSGRIGSDFLVKAVRFRVILSFKKNNHGVILEGQVLQEGKRFRKFTASLCHQGGIYIGGVCYNLISIDIWLKTMLKTLVKIWGGVNSSCCRGVSLGTKSNICRRGFWGHVGMETPDGAIEKKQLEIRRVHGENQSCIGRFGWVYLQ